MIKVRRSEFISSVLTLMTGTTIAQAIPIAISPILTRIYTPQDFGVLTLYLSLVSIFAVIATLRYELSIVQPLKNEDAASLVVLSVIIAISISFVLSVIIFAFHGEILTLIGKPEIGPWLYLLPVSVFLIGTYQSLDYWNTRIKEYKKIAIAKIAQGGGASVIQVGSGALNFKGGLVWGLIAGQFIASMILLLRVLNRDKALFRKVNGTSVCLNAKRYKKFPMHSSLGAMADTVSLQMPVFMLTTFYQIGITGIFSFTFRVLNLPMSLLSKSLAQVLFQKITHMHNHNPHDIRKMIIQIFVVLLVIMLPFVIFIYSYGESFFSFVFGKDWGEAGSYASILVFAVAIRFAVSPLSIVLAMDHNVKLGVVWQTIYLVTISSTLYFFRLSDIHIFLYAFVWHELFLYLLYFAFILKGAKYFKDQ